MKRWLEYFDVKDARDIACNHEKFGAILTSNKLDASRVTYFFTGDALVLICDQSTRTGVARDTFTLWFTLSPNDLPMCFRSGRVHKPLAF